MCMDGKTVEEKIHALIYIYISSQELLLYGYTTLQVPALHLTQS